MMYNQWFCGFFCERGYFKGLFLFSVHLQLGCCYQCTCNLSFVYSSNILLVIREEACIIFQNHISNNFEM